MEIEVPLPQDEAGALQTWIRQHKGRSQLEVGKMLGLSQARVSEMARGKIDRNLRMLGVAN